MEREVDDKGGRRASKGGSPPFSRGNKDRTSNPLTFCSCYSPPLARGRETIDEAREREAK